MVESPHQYGEEIFMHKNKGIAILCILAMAVGSISGCTVTVNDPNETEESAAPEVVEPESYRAQDNFYMYVNADAIENAVFSYGASSAGMPLEEQMIVDQVEGIVNDVVAGSGYEVGSEEYIIQQAYNLYLDYDFENAGVPPELDAMMHEIDEVSSIEEFLELDARISREYAAGNYFRISVDFDYLDASHRIVSFSQYRSMQDADFTALEDSYDSLNSLKESSSAFLQAMGHDKEYSDEIGNQVGYFAMDIYNATDMDIVEDLMPFTYFEVHSFDEMQEVLSNVDLASYLTSLGIDPEYQDEFGLVDLGQLEALNAALTEDNLEALKAFELLRFGSCYIDFIAYGYDELSDYRTINYATAEQQAMNFVTGKFAAQTDPLYVEQYYSQETDDALISMCDDIRESYRGLISEASWLSEETRQGLLEKLDNIVYVTGGNLHRADPSEYSDLCFDDLFSLVLSNELHNQNELFEELAEPVDRTAPQMRMQIFNACYDPSFNNITITCAIANEPFFSTEQDYYTNLGGLGMVIAHEMGHAFDSNCIAFDQNGNYNPSWISDQDVETLNARNEAAVSYFQDNFTVFGIYHVDGEQTLGENYADLGGLECISRIAQTQEQREAMFTNFAVIWCEKTLDESVIHQLDVDPHSPHFIRVNAMLSTLEAFYETYNVTEGDGMYIAPENRISRWY